MLQNIVFSVLFVLGLIAGGAASAANAADVSDDLDTLSFLCDNPPNDLWTEICDDIEQLRNSMAAAAVSFSISELVCSYVAIILYISLYCTFLIAALIYYIATYTIIAFVKF